MELAQQIGRIGAKVRPNARPKGNTAEKAQGRTAGNHRNAFLKQRFFPLMGDDNDEMCEAESIERGFLNSLSNLCALYGWQVPKILNLPFPANIAPALRLAGKLLKEQDSELQLRLFYAEDDSRLATVKTFDTKMTLFYFPIAPVYRLYHRRKTQAVGEIILSIYAYLYQIAGICHYCDSYSYLGGIYEMIAEWITEDDGEYSKKERSAYKRHFKMMEEKGEISKLMMSDKSQLEKFPERIAGFSPKTEEESELLEVASEVLLLYGKYPNSSIVGRCLEPFGMDRDENCIRSEQYMGFIWDFKDMVYEQFIHSVNAELNECCAMEEPTAFQFFDRPQTCQQHDQEFEKLFFPLLHKIIDAIYLFEK